MKRVPLFLLLLAAVLMAGCETINHQDREVLRAHDVPPNVYDKMLYGDPLSLSDVIALSQRGVPPGLIIHYMDQSDTAYRLRKADVKQLRSAGVSEQVISYMLSTGAPYGPGPYPYPGPYAGPYGYPYPYYPYDDFYGGPLLVVGGGYYHGWGHGGWGRGGGWGGHHR
jgi:hypothetical protein